MALGWFIRGCAILVPLLSACCDEGEKRCERSDIIDTIRDTAGDPADDCGRTLADSAAGIRRCIDDAMENGRGYFFTREGDFEHTFIATKDGEHFDIVVDPDRRSAERFHCPQIRAGEPLPDCDLDQAIREDIVCDSGACGARIASSP